jgi:hypothetical protein
VGDRELRLATVPRTSTASWSSEPVISAAAWDSASSNIIPGGRDEGEAFGDGLSLGAPGCCGVGEVLSEPVDEGREFHDATTTSI